MGLCWAINLGNSKRLMTSSIVLVQMFETHKNVTWNLFVRVLTRGGERIWLGEGYYEVWEEGLGSGEDWAGTRKSRLMTGYWERVIL